MKKPFRFWMTSGVAMLVAAVSGGALAAADERSAVSRTSRFGVTEAVQRIDASAQRVGMHVMACLPQQLNALTGESRYLIVLESSQGGTPVWMDTESARPSLLLSIYLRRSDGGGTEVFLPERLMRDLPDGLPDLVQAELAELPRVLDEALFS